MSHPDDLHVWGKKKFIESFIAWGELEQDKFLLPDGEIKNLLAGVAQAKMLPAPSSDWSECRARGEQYRERLAEYSAEVRQLQLTANKSGRLWESDEERKQALASLGQHEADRAVIDRVHAQKAALAAKGFVLSARDETSWRIQRQAASARTADSLRAASADGEAGRALRRKPSGATKRISRSATRDRIQL